MTRIPAQQLRTLIAFARIGYWITRKWHRRLADAGGDEEARAYVAKQMKKQGYPDYVAAPILARAPVSQSSQPPERHAP